MKKHAQFILVTIAMALYATTRAAANDPQWQVIDNHHGASTYLPRTGQPATTIAFGGTAKGTGSTAPKTQRISTSTSTEKPGFREISTPHGTVNYFVPAE